MAIVKRNNYLPGQNLTNLSENVDLNRVGDDKTFISVDYGTSPATVTIEAGSIIEANGAVYDITSDEIFQMTSTSHLYIIFDGTAFSSAATIGTERPDKGGFYQSDNTSRTLKFIIDQTNSRTSLDSVVLFNSADDLSITTDLYADDNIIVENDIEIINGDIDGEVDILGNSKVRTFASSTTISGIGNPFPFDNEVFDTLGEYNNSTYVFTASEAGYYMAGCIINGSFTSGAVGRSISMTITTTASPARVAQTQTVDQNGGGGIPHSLSCHGYTFLNVGDTIQFIYGVSASSFIVPSNSSDMYIYRVA